MKITKSELVKIVNEEIENILNEGKYGDYQDSGPRWNNPDKTEDDYNPETGMSYLDSKREDAKYRSPYKKSAIPIKIDRGMNDTTKKYKERIETYLKDVTYNKFLESVVTHINKNKDISKPQIRTADKIMGVETDGHEESL